MNDIIKNTRIPGLLWAILIIVAVGLIHANEALLAQYGIEPWMIDMGLAFLIGILKTLSLPGDQLTQALDVIDDIVNADAGAKRERQTAVQSAPGVGMRSAYGPPVPLPEADVKAIAAEAPERPSWLAQLLVG